jgi:hypothetical protein
MTKVSDVFINCSPSAPMRQMFGIEQTLQPKIAR